MITCVVLVTYTLMAPPAPAGTIAAFATTLLVYFFSLCRASYRSVAAQSSAWVTGCSLRMAAYGYSLYEFDEKRPPGDALAAPAQALGVSLTKSFAGLCSDFYFSGFTNTT